MKILKKTGIVSFLAIGLFFTTYPLAMYSQEYKYEIGGAAGTSFYMGDANKTKFYLHPGVAGGAMFRYNISFHWAAKANLFIGNVSGNSSDSGSLFPGDRQASFHRTFADLGAQVEFHFFPYSDKYAYLGTKPYTPYLFAGAGATLATGEKRFFDANLPFGIGFKYKLKNRMNIGIEFSMQKLFGDDFDVTEETLEWNLDAPYGIKSSFLKNQDWYSTTMIYLTWEFGIREDPCRGM
jgi:hypothetical protein